MPTVVFSLQTQWPRPMLTRWENCWEQSDESKRKKRPKKQTLIYEEIWYDETPLAKLVRLNSMYWVMKWNRSKKDRAYEFWIARVTINKNFRSDAWVCVLFLLFFCMCALEALYSRDTSQIIMFDMCLHRLSQAMIGHSKAHQNAMNIVFYCRCMHALKKTEKNEQALCFQSKKFLFFLLLDKVAIGSAKKKCTRTMAVNTKVKQGCAHNKHISPSLSLLSSASRFTCLQTSHV